MRLTLVRAAPVLALIDLERVKARLRITSASEDETLTEIIAEASNGIAALLGDPLVRQTYREPVCGSRLELARWPVDPGSVAVTLDDEAYADWTLTDPAHGKLRLLRSPVTQPLPGEDDDRHSVTYSAGYIPPGSTSAPGVVTTWEAEADYLVGAWARPSSPALSPYLMECTTAGTAGATEPAWPAAEETVADGTAVWTARQVEELPAILRQCAFATARSLYVGETQRSPGMAGWTLPGGVSETFFATHAAEFFPPATKLALLAWRANR